MGERSQSRFHRLFRRPLARIGSSFGTKDAEKRIQASDVASCAEASEVSKAPPTSPSNDQTQSAFLSNIPAEVRWMVYCHVLCVPVPVVHVVRRKDGTLCHVRCKASKGECGTYRCYNDYSELSRTTRDDSASTEKRRVTSEGLLSLPLTCKKVYMEAINIIYSENYFSFLDLPIIVDFSNKTPKQRFDCISKVQFEYKIYSTIRHFYPSLEPALGGTLTWPKMRQILSSMQGLHEVRVKAAKVPESHGTPGMTHEVIRITEFVADRTDGTSELMRQLLEVNNVEFIIEEVC